MKQWLVMTMLLAAAGDAAAQAQVTAPFLPRSPMSGGAGVFVMPHAQSTLGRLHVGAEAGLGWGGAVARQGGGFAGFTLFQDVYVSGGWKGSVLNTDQLNGSERTLVLSIAGSHAGVAVAKQFGDTRADAFTSELRGSELRAWASLGQRLDLGLSMRITEIAERTQSQDVRRYVVAGYEFVSTSRIDFLRVAEHRDVELDATVQVAGFLVSGFAGRGFADSFTSQRTWAYARVERPLPQGLSLLLEAGRNDGGLDAVPVPRGFARLGFRMDLTRREPALRPTDTLVRAPTALAALDETGDAPRLMITSPHATHVDVRGDFTRWETVPMTRAPDGAWTTPVHAGVLRFNIRIDNRTWTVPAGMPVVTDEFSGQPVAVVVVRAR
jgi:hypothetical protein